MVTVYFQIKKSRNNYNYTFFHSIDLYIQDYRYYINNFLSN